MKKINITILSFIFVIISLRAESSYQSRGIYYLTSKSPCALNGYGNKIKDNACVRLTLFDENTNANVDLNNNTINVSNSEKYEDDYLVLDLLLPGTCYTEEGTKRVYIHYKIEKKKKKYHPQIHAHFTTRAKCNSVELDAFQIQNSSDGSILISKEDASSVVTNPSKMNRFLKELVEVDDNLEGKISEDSDGRTIGDITVKVGKGKLSKKIVNTRFILRNNKAKDNKNLISLLNDSDWEIQIQSLTSLFPKEVLRNELFLIGLNDDLLHKYLKENGLPKKKSIIFKKVGKKGTLLWPEGKLELNNYQDTIKAFFTGTFIGTIFLEKLESNLK